MIAISLLQGAPSPDLASSIDARYQAAAAEGWSGSVLVVKAGHPVLSKGYGIADPKANLNVQPTTLFSIGSVTKWFTALATLRLEQEGKLKLTDSIAKTIVGVPADKRAITIGHLLAHSAGLGEYIDRPGEGGDFAKIDKAKALKRILGEKLLFKPGARSEYSNVGFTLLAMVIEKASGQSYEQCVRERVFQPAGMTRSGFFGDQTWPANEFAVGRNARTHGTRNAAHAWGPVTWSIMGAGGIVSTAEDLGKAIRALADHKLLAPAATKRMFKPLLEQEGPGWVVAKTPAGTPFCNVGGGDEFGFQTDLIFLPQEGHLVIACSNSDTPQKMHAANFDVLKLLK